MLKTESGAALHDVLERICSLFRAQLREAASQHDLKLVQLEALIYLSMANRYSNTAGALAEYVGVTKGTASQTVIALERKGLVEKATDPADARVTRCTLTAQGRSVVKSSHPVALLAELPGERREEAVRAALELLRAIQAGNDFRSFGQCHSCAHFRKNGNQRQCGLTQERLTTADSLAICREHRHAAT